MQTYGSDINMAFKVHDDMAFKNFMLRSCNGKPQIFSAALSDLVSVTRKGHFEPFYFVNWHFLSVPSGHFGQGDQKGTFYFIN